MNLTRRTLLKGATALALFQQLEHKRKLFPAWPRYAFSDRVDLNARIRELLSDVTITSIYIPPGDYFMSGPIYIPNKQLLIEGCDIEQRGSGPMLELVNYDKDHGPATLLNLTIHPPDPREVLW